MQLEKSTFCTRKVIQTKYIRLNYLSCIRYFGLPMSVICTVYRIVHVEESRLLYWSQRDVHPFCRFGMTFT